MHDPIGLRVQKYRDFLKFWDKHDPDLAEGARAAYARCEKVWGLSEGPHLAGLEKLGALTAGMLGRAVAVRLFHEREELLQDEAFRCDAGLRLWSIHEAGFGDAWYKNLNHPKHPKAPEGLRENLASRRRRYTDRLDALHEEQGVEIPLSPDPRHVCAETARNPKSFRIRLFSAERTDFRDFWHYHDPDMAGAVSAILRKRPETWTDPERFMPTHCLGLLGEFLAKELGRETVHRLFWRWEETLADEAFRYEVGVKLWELADAAPESPRMARQRKHFPAEYADDIAAEQQKREQRLARYARRKQELWAGQSMVAETPA